MGQSKNLVLGKLPSIHINDPKQDVLVDRWGRIGH